MWDIINFFADKAPFLVFGAIVGYYGYLKYVKGEGENMQDHTDPIICPDCKLKISQELAQSPNTSTIQENIDIVPLVENNFYHELLQNLLTNFHYLLDLFS
jgi:hypothetical protein